MRARVMKITLTLMVSLGVVYCEPPLSNQYGVPANLPVSSNQVSHGAVTNSYGAPLGSDDHHDEHQDYIDSQPKSYDFGYAVKDSATGNDFGRRESSDGETVRGEYRVQLPDGRVQIVTYTADWRTGFHADVRYEGEATYPDQYNTGYNNGYNNNNNAFNSGFNNFNNYNNAQAPAPAPGFNYNQIQPQAPNYNQGGNYNYQGNQGNQGNYNGYQQSQNTDYNSYNNNQNPVGPRPTYGTPQFH